MTKPGYTKVTVEMTGPLFSADVDRVYGQNLVDMLEGVAQEGEDLVRRQIESRSASMPYYTGWSRDSVRGRVVSVSGKKWHRHAVVSAYTGDMDKKDAIRTKAAASSIERRRHPFRKVKSASYRAVKAANLTKGLS